MGYSNDIINIKKNINPIMLVFLIWSVYYIRMIFKLVFLDSERREEANGFAMVFIFYFYIL